MFEEVKRVVTVAVNGGFDPLHRGHLEHFKMARQLGDRLIVLLNSDEWLMRKKGYVFMPFDDRKAIIESLSCVDAVIPVVDGGDTVTETLRMMRPDVLAKGGDRDRDHMPEEELKVCNELGIDLVFHVHDPSKKDLSSSKMVSDACKNMYPLLRRKGNGQ